MDAELTVGFMHFKEKYVSTVTCVPYKSVQVCIYLFLWCFLSALVCSLIFVGAGCRVVDHASVQDVVDYLEIPKRGSLAVFIGPPS